MSFQIPEYSNRQKFQTGLAGIKRIFANPCDTPLTIYLELAAPAAGRLVIGLVSFGMTDLIRAYFRPRGLRGGRHMGRGRRGRRGGGGIPDSAELVAKLIPGYGAAKARVTTDGVKFLWRIDTVIQAGLFKLLIYNLFKDFIADSTTSILEFEAENCDVGGAALREGTGNGGAAVGEQGFIVQNSVYRRGLVTTSPGGFAWSAGIGQVVLANTIQVAPTAAGPSVIRMGIRYVKGGQTRTDWGEAVSVAPGDRRAAFAVTTLNGPTSCSFILDRQTAQAGTGVEASAFCGVF